MISDSTWKSSSVISPDVLKLVKDFSGTPLIIASITTGAQPTGRDYWGTLKMSIRSVWWEGIQPVDCGPLCTLSAGLTVAQALVMRCNMSGALIKRHSHVDSTNDWVQLNILDKYFEVCLGPQKTLLQWTVLMASKYHEKWVLGLFVIAKFNEGSQTFYNNANTF